MFAYHTCKHYLLEIAQINTLQSSSSMSRVPTWLGRHHHTSPVSFLSRFVQKMPSHPSLKDRVPFICSWDLCPDWASSARQDNPSYFHYGNRALPRVRLAPVAETSAVIRAGHQIPRQIEETPKCCPVRPAGDPEREDLGKPTCQALGVVEGSHSGCQTTRLWAFLGRHGQKSQKV